MGDVPDARVECAVCENLWVRKWSGVPVENVSITPESMGCSVYLIISHSSRSSPHTLLGSGIQFLVHNETMDSIAFRAEGRPQNNNA